MKTVSLKYGKRGDKPGAAFHYVQETEGISRDERKFGKNLYY